MKRLLLSAYERLTHAIGRATGRYFFEDFKRVYPDGLAYNRFGMRVAATKFRINNYLNHRKFYVFASQFVQGKRVADIGCGSGYGSHILKESGASFVAGSDISKPAIRYAKSHFDGEFIVTGATDLSHYPDNSFDVAISSEVLEHVLEYGMEAVAVAEMKRIVRPGGLIVIGTPNTEMSKDHGFSFDQIGKLMADNFTTYVVFENALLPFQDRRLWEERVRSNRVGTIVSEAINFDETVLPAGVTPEVKKGEAPGTDFPLGDFLIDTTLLHNTHSWTVLAVNATSYPDQGL